uniref:Uncharacterized protein n=1 Tax=Plectus sambesii TaxID=2011161 RepID=A0A914W8X8_9BILA
MNREPADRRKTVPPPRIGYSPRSATVRALIASRWGSSGLAATGDRRRLSSSGCLSSRVMGGIFIAEVFPRRQPRTKRTIICTKRSLAAVSGIAQSPSLFHRSERMSVNTTTTALRLDCVQFTGPSPIRQTPGDVLCNVHMTQTP